MIEHFIWPSPECSRLIKRQGAFASRGRGPVPAVTSSGSTIPYEVPTTASGSVRRISWTAARRIVPRPGSLGCALSPRGLSPVGGPPGAVIACTGRPRGQPCASDLELVPLAGCRNYVPTQPWQLTSVSRLPSYTTWPIWTETNLVFLSTSARASCRSKALLPARLETPRPLCLATFMFATAVDTLFPAPAQAQRLGWRCLPFLPHSRPQWCLNVLLFRPLPNGASKPHSALLLRGYGKLLFHDRQPLTTALVLAPLTGRPLESQLPPPSYGTGNPHQP